MNIYSVVYFCKSERHFTPLLPQTAQRMDKRVVFIAVLLASLELSLVMSFPFPAKDLSKVYMI